MGAGTLLYGIRATYDSEVNDTVSIRIAYDHDSDVTDYNDIIDVVNAATIATGTPVPRRRQRLSGTSLFARDFSVEQDANKKSRFYFDVTFRKPDTKGTATAAVAELHPIYHPPTVTIQYQEKEIIIEKAYNVQAVTGGAARSADTLGYIQNGAGVVSQTPILDTIRSPVIVIRRNVASLATVLSLNETYQLTTNETALTVEYNSFAARTLKYQGTDAGDEQEFEGISYWQIETRIEIHKTTDVTVDSVGTQEINGSGEMLSILDANGSPITEPIPINLDGTAGTPGTSVQMTYYYLEEVDYTPLLG